MYTFTRWVRAAENLSALLAVQRVAERLGRASGGLHPQLAASRVADSNPLFLHGPAGTGKTHLVNALAADVTRHRPDLVIAVLSAGDLRPTEEESADLHARLADESLADADLLILEDLQRLPESAREALVQLLDSRLARQQQTVLTANVGPGRLTGLPARLASRLACGLVVGLEPLSPPSRLAFLQDRVSRRQLAVAPEVLAWLAEQLPGSGRTLEGAVTRLEALARLHGRVPDLAAVAEDFGTDREAARPTVERIADRVGRCFGVEARAMQSRRRCRSAMLPRQVGMYLARQLTPLSLEQIGAYFGGRDHSTVLHACRKVEEALDRDPALSGAVRLLRAELA